MRGEPLNGQSHEGVTQSGIGVRPRKVAHKIGDPAPMLLNYQFPPSGAIVFQRVEA